MPISRFFNHTLVIERATAGAVDDRGVPAQTWTPLATVHASVQDIDARELAQLSQGGPTTATKKVYLYPTDIEDSDRLREGSAILQIDQKLDPAGAGHHLKLLVHEVSGA